MFEIARARPWIAARCVLAALGQLNESFETPEESAPARLVGARIIAEGFLSVAEAIKALAQAHESKGR